MKTNIYKSMSYIHINVKINGEILVLSQLIKHISISSDKPSHNPQVAGQVASMKLPYPFSGLQYPNFFQYPQPAF